MPQPLRSNRVPAWISATLLIAGSLLFIGGGGLHPKAATAFGVVGTPAFYRTFADHILMHPNWIAIHVLILVGPILWALGLPRPRSDRERTGATDALDASDSFVRPALEHLASRALLLGAALWSVVFVLDGFVAPQAAALVASAAQADAAGMLAIFRVNQVTVIRLGLVSWILIGASMALHGGALLGRARTLSPARVVLGAVGVAIGVWPVIAIFTGSFDPGPFTSPHWNVTALSTAAWFVAFGVSLLVRERAAVTNAGDHRDESRDSISHSGHDLAHQV
jgi:hypothetical protein